jgi:transcriptional regulator with XRE-family HTH domain
VNYLALITLSRLDGYRLGVAEDGLGQFADSADLNRNYVGMIEREENAPTVDALEQLSDALNVDPVSFFKVG